MVSGLFDYWQYLFEFSEVFEYGYAALGNCEDYSAFAGGSFFNETLFDEEVQVLFEYTAVDVCFVHDMRQF